MLLINSQVVRCPAAEIDHVDFFTAEPGVFRVVVPAIVQDIVKPDAGSFKSYVQVIDSVLK
jgi:hypothetical protein